jgi:hypothetical protein
MLPTQFLHLVLSARKRHTGRDEVEIRYPVVCRCFLDSPPQADFATSGMTELML